MHVGVDNSVRVIDFQYVQLIAEENFNRRLTDEEMEIVRDAFYGDCDDVRRYIDDAVFSAVEYAINYKKDE